MITILKNLLVILTTGLKEESWELGVGHIPAIGLTPLGSDVGIVLWKKEINGLK